MLSRQITDRLRGLRTPFYLYDMELLRKTLRAVVESSSRYGYKVHYALKANNDKRIFETVREHGLGVDCVSGNEVRYAVESGFAPGSIVFAGVGKSDDEIRYAVREGIFAFNCESRGELHVINAIAAAERRVADVALRVNPDVDPMTHRHISTGHGESKFGIAPVELEAISGELPAMKNVRITGLHFHIGSQIRDMEVFMKLCLRVNEICHWARGTGFDITHVNAGGGLGVDYDDPEAEPVPDFDRYFKVFHDTLSLDPGVGVHFELGRSIVAQCGELITRVLYNKTTAAGTRVTIVDASMTELMRPALYGARHAIENLTGAGRPAGHYMVGGTVCESSDVFADDAELPEPERGDLLSIKSAGAYGCSMASRYNMHDLPGAAYSDELA